MFIVYMILRTIFGILTLLRLNVFVVVRVINITIGHTHIDIHSHNSDPVGIATTGPVSSYDWTMYVAKFTIFA